MSEKRTVRNKNRSEKWHVGISPACSNACNQSRVAYLKNEFLLYVNDIPDHVITTAKMFADDTKVYNEINSIADCDTLQNDLNSLAVWSKLWLLEFNAEKCVVLRIKKALEYHYSLNGVYLQEVNDQKDLGIKVSNTLTPNKHIQEIVKKARQKIAMFFFFFFFFMTWHNWALTAETKKKSFRSCWRRSAQKAINLPTEVVGLTATHRWEMVFTLCLRWFLDQNFPGNTIPGGDFW